MASRIHNVLEEKDASTSLLFNSVLEYVIKKSKRNRNSWTKLADRVNLFEENINIKNNTISVQASKDSDLKVNMIRTKYINMTGTKTGNNYII